MGLNPADAIYHLYNNGIAKLIDVEYPDYWPFTDRQLCNYYPPSRYSDNNSASLFKIDEASIIKDGVSTWDQIKVLKNAIASGKPIFLEWILFPNHYTIHMIKTFGDLVHMSQKTIVI